MKGRLLVSGVGLFSAPQGVSGCNTGGSRVSGMTAMMAYSRVSRWSGVLGVCAIVATIPPAQADPRAVVELFTSQGCSSCPPADRILGELAQDPSIIALTMPIDYWDYLGWKDTLADARFSARQKAYSQARGDREVYTPQVVVNGSVHVLGSDRARIDGAIDTTKKSDDVMSVPVTMTQTGKQLNVSVAGSGKGAAAMHGEVWICSISKAVPISIQRGETSALTVPVSLKVQDGKVTVALPDTDKVDGLAQIWLCPVTDKIPVKIERGENSGHDLTYYDVVRRWVKLAQWSGKAETFSMTIDDVLKGIGGEVDRIAVLVQKQPDGKPGLMLGAAEAKLK